jgi:hypothetical protein
MRVAPMVFGRKLFLENSLSRRDRLGRALSTVIAGRLPILKAGARNRINHFAGGKGSAVESGRECVPIRNAPVRALHSGLAAHTLEKASRFFENTKCPI